jgi:hypothetical protein
MKGTRVVARMIRNVKKGDEIGENYGPIFTQTRREERRNVLRENYFFECQCQPCKGNTLQSQCQLCKKDLQRPPKQHINNN